MTQTKTKKTTKKTTSPKKDTVKKETIKKEEVKEIVKEETKTVSKPKKIVKGIGKFFNHPGPLFITLIVIIFVLLMFISNLMNRTDMFVGEIDQNNIVVKNIHFFTDGKTRYFYADRATFLGEDKDIYEYQIGYYVVNEKGEYIELASRSAKLEESIKLSQIITDMSGWNFPENVETEYFFTKEVMQNLKKLHFVIKASTVKDNSTADVVIDNEVYITSFK